MASVVEYDKIEINDKTDTNTEAIKAIISYEELPTKDIVDYEMIVTPLDPVMLDFFRNWYPVFNLIKSQSLFRPIF